MGNIRVQPSGKLYFDFRYLGKRCREVTALPNTALNRKRLARISHSAPTTFADQAW